MPASKETGLFREIAVAVITAAALGAAGLLWNWLSSGGLIHAMGIATKDDLEKVAKGTSDSPLAASAPGLSLEAGSAQKRSGIEEVQFSKIYKKIPTVVVSGYWSGGTESKSPDIIIQVTTTGFRVSSPNISAQYPYYINWVAVGER